MEIFKIITDLEELRKIPQFLFLSDIQPNSMLKVRDEIIEYKTTNPSIDEIDFIIHSGGGSPADAYRIIRTLRNNFDKVNVIIPFWAKSAATLLSLGATKIIMDEFGEFGPLDIQIGVEKEDGPELERVSALIDEYSVRRIESRAQELYHQMFLNLYANENVKINKNELSRQLLDYLAAFYKPLLTQINSYNLGKNKRRLDIGEKYAHRILVLYNPDLPEDGRNLLIDFLVNRCPDHGFVIDYSIMSSILTNVKLSSEINTDYEKTLRNLTTILLNWDDHAGEFVGFIKKDPDTPENNSKANSQSQQSQSESVNNGTDSNLQGNKKNNAHGVIKGNKTNKKDVDISSKS